MRLLWVFCWAFFLAPLWAGGPDCAQTAGARISGAWEPEAAANKAPQTPLVPRATPVQVAPLAAPGGWAAAPAANRPAEKVDQETFVGALFQAFAETVGA